MTSPAINLPRNYVKYTCDACGSMTVVVRAEMYWNFHTQRWELEELADSYAYCNDCDADREFTESHLTYGEYRQECIKRELDPMPLPEDGAL